VAGDDDQPQGTKYAFDISGEVESDPEWWKARGKTAEQAAEDLQILAQNAEQICRTNHYGKCVEGETTHELFRGIVTTWARDLREQSTSARNLAEACFAAAKTLSDTDYEAASHIGPF